METKKTPTPQILLWVDLEMTGLDPMHDAILEVAAIVTDFSYKPIASYEAIIHHPESVLTGANEWSYAQHSQSGLFDRVRNSQKTEETVVRELGEFIHMHCGADPVVLAGNSIHQDRAFIRHQWKSIEALLHYRMLDVSSLKIIVQGMGGAAFEKQESHRAHDDILESIAELAYCLHWIKTDLNIPIIK